MKYLLFLVTSCGLAMFSEWRNYLATEVLHDIDSRYPKNFNWIKSSWYKFLGYTLIVLGVGYLINEFGWYTILIVWFAQVFIRPTLRDIFFYRSSAWVLPIIGTISLIIYLISIAQINSVYDDL